MKSIYKLGIILLFSSIILGIDQTSKAWAQTNLTNSDVRILSEPDIRLSLAYNKGAAFGFFLGSNLPYFILGALVIIFLIIWVIRDEQLSQDIMTLSAFGCTCGGILGNLMDRIKVGSVVDFIDFTFFSNFNIADISLVLGTAVILLKYWRIADNQESNISINNRKD